MTTPSDQFIGWASISVRITIGRWRLLRKDSENKWDPAEPTVGFDDVRQQAFVVVLCVPMLVAEQESRERSLWDPLKFFIGHWVGVSQGQSGAGKGKRDYEFVLGGKFLQLKNKSVYPAQEKNPKGETHEDLALFSYDRQRKKFVLRKFHVEGFVNQYVEQERAAGSKSIVFVSEAIENIPEWWRARETYKFVGPDEYIEVFELAPPNKEFAVYSESRWKRRK